MPSIPTGTVTFLFTDIEGSTRRWEQFPGAMQSAISQHDEVLRGAIEEHGGYVFKTVGDAFCAAFAVPTDALEAAVVGQRALHSAQWPSEVGELRVRMALHTGVVDETGGDYFGRPVNRVARLLYAGYGGQVLISDPTYALIRDNPPPGIAFLDLGEHRLEDLIRPEHIYQVVAEGLPSQFPPLRTLNNRPNNLPVQLTPFIGREREIEAVCALLRQPTVRLVTLTGTGGTGKTRLSLQAAAEALDDFPDGVWFVELATLTSADHRLVASTIAQALGVTEVPGKAVMDALKDYLKEKDLLLLLDNFEQVAGAAPQVSELLRSAPGVKALVTSRVKLNLYGEREYAVPPLTLPDIRQGHLPPLTGLTQYEAVRLFIERAQAAKADFEVTNDNAPAVAEICVRLDGLPLAIELAAARIKILSPQVLLTRLSSRLKLLTGGARNLSARQQTLRGAIDWSYDLLSKEEQQLFRRMAVFNGGRTLEALEQVCNFDGQLEVDVLDGVQSLLDKSLLQEREGLDGEPRFWMLETIHEYAREKLQESGEAQPLYREHALYFMRLAEEAEPHLKGGRQVEWLNRLEDEHDNLRALFAWVSSQGTGGNPQDEVSPGEIGLRVAAALGRFWEMRGHVTEGRERLAGALSHTQTAEGNNSRLIVTRAAALSAAAALAIVQGDYAPAQTLLTESLSLSREHNNARGVTMALIHSGRLAMMEGDYSEAWSLLEEGLAHSKELGDGWGMGVALQALGAVASWRGDRLALRAYTEQALAIRRQIGDKWGMAMSLNNLGVAMRDAGDYRVARAHIEESLQLRRELGNTQGIGMSLYNIGLVANQQGDFAYARNMLRDALVIFRDLKHRQLTAEALRFLSDVERLLGNYADARACAEESVSIHRDLGNRVALAESLLSVGLLDGYEGEYERGTLVLEESKLLFEEAGYKGVLAGGLPELGIVARWRGDYESAATTLARALAWFRAEGLNPEVNWLLVERGLVAWCAGDYQNAEALLHEALALAHEIGREYDFASALAVLGAAAIEEALEGAVAGAVTAEQVERIERGVVMASAAEALFSSMGTHLALADRKRYAETLHKARDVLGDAVWQQVWARGSSMEPSEAAALALRAAHKRDEQWK